MHLFWKLPPSLPLVEVAVVLEVRVPPVAQSLYFWALQVDFVGRGVTLGGGHTGLQWYPRFPQSAAVNWGGYASAENGGGVLTGSVSSLPTFPDEANTFAYPWVAGREYSIRVFAAPDVPGVWRSEVTDLGTGQATLVRDLYAGGDRLASPMVWSEVFADCDAPSVTVRWSGFRAVDESGAVVTPTSAQVNYQSYEDGGCTNTTAMADDDGILQVTNTGRTVAQGVILGIASRPPGIPPRRDWP
jgi:hypothetical protein